MNRSLLFLLIIVLLAVHLALGQSYNAPVEPVTGTPAFGSYGGGPFDIVNLANLNVHFGIPIVAKAGRGTPFTFDWVYDSSIWYIDTNNNQWQHPTNWGWKAQTEVITGYVRYWEQSEGCPVGEGGLVIDWFTYYAEPLGTKHNFPVNFHIVTVNQCGGSTTPFPVTAYANDGSGYSITITCSNYNNNCTKVYSPSGAVITPPVLQEGTSGNGSGVFTDNNGDEITTDGTNFTDTLNVKDLTVSGAPPNAFKFLNPQDTYSTITVSYGSYHVKTEFYCPGIAEFDSGQYNVSLISGIALPGSAGSYAITYEKWPDGYYTGRIASITLPTGGKISYSYSGGTNGIECADGSAAKLTRQTPDGTWTYERSGTPPSTTTTVTAPDGQSSKTVITFSGIYETNRTVKQGSTLIDTITTCYNGTSLANCPGATNLAPPFSDVAVYQQLPISGLVSMRDTAYDTSNGDRPTAVTVYDYGNSPHGGLLQSAAISYATFVPVQNQNTTILDRPSQIKVTLSGGTVKALTTYAYDENKPAASGIGTNQQHATITCNPSSSYNCRGNLTTVTYTTQGSSTLSKKFAYYDTGSINTVTDVNSAGATYKYSGNTADCNMAFPTSISLPVNSLSQSMTWDCNGGVMKTFTDPSGNPASWTYNDPNYWRPTATTDQGGNQTTLSYSATSVESTLSFNSSAVDILATLDVLGRPHVVQQRQTPGGSNFDSVETDYDGMGRPYRTTMPYLGTQGQTNSSAPATTTAYDMLNRVTNITDGGNGWQTFAFNPGGSWNNDVLLTLGPKPTNENTKQRQLQYDGLGRLTSVCELTSANGSGQCPQSTTQTGFYTSYTYDGTAGANSLKVTQGAQTRTYVYDMLGRLTSETNPETGTTNYFWDTSAPDCSNATGGDLSEKKTNSGIVTCYWHDALHRLQGDGKSGSPCQIYAYDNLNPPANPLPTGVIVANTAGRLIEAYTNPTCNGGTPTTDEWFSYSQRGEVTDIYESTPNSGGYYHIAKTYWPNGALATLSGLPGVPTIYYGASDGSGLDGEGRITQVTVPPGAGQNPAQSITYDNSGNDGQPLGAMTVLQYGSGAFDNYSYDPNTGRMLGYAFYVGSSGQAVTATLNWNQNGTLQGLNIVDPFNSANQQNCTYSYDDLARISGANCGSAWAQTFSFDPFGNITKSGSISWTPNYANPSNNQYQSGWNNISYGSDGNLTYDTFNSYQWDANGHATVITNNGVSSNQTYDALGHMVEQNWNNGGWIGQYLYDSSGYEFGFGVAGSVGWTFVPLPGGASTVYTNGTQATYDVHPDWQGSGRFSSPQPPNGLGSPPTSDMAFAPYGERYSIMGNPNDGVFAGMKDLLMPAGGFDAIFRDYHATQGRWVSPDPAGLAAVDMANPQTWNRYAYVMNNPLGYVDPSGLYCWLWGDHWEGSRGCSQGNFANFFEQLLFLGAWGYNDPSNDNGWVQSDLPPASLINSGVAANNGTCGTTVLPRSVGLSYGGNVDAGAGYEGITGTASAGVGIFANGNTGVSTGRFAGGGATAYFFNGNVGVPTQQGQPFNFGGYAGAGPSIWISNAGGAPQLGGPFTTLSLNVGFGPVKGSLQLSYGGGIWQLSVGPPIPFVSPGTPSASVSKLTTKTATTSGCQ